MNTLDGNKGIEDSRFAGIVKGVVVGLLMVGAVVVGSGMNRQAAIAADATVATAADDAQRAGYFPARFPAPQGAAEPHVEAF